MDATHCVLGLSLIRSYFLAASDIKSSFQDVIFYLPSIVQHEGCLQGMKMIIAYAKLFSVSVYYTFAALRII